MPHEIYKQEKGEYRLLYPGKKYEKKRWIKCVNCGKRVDNADYHFCYWCFTNWNRNKKRFNEKRYQKKQEELNKYCIIDSDEDK